MTHLMRGLVLVVGMSGLVLAGGGFIPAPAQDKKDTKTGTVEIYKDKSGEYRFRIKDADGKVIAMTPKGYDTKEECHKALDLVKATLNTAKVIEVKEDKK
jgi:uncharacterized protein YegP (UPF0339 family)